MRAMILAAGRGERMGVLTEKTPKPLLRAGDNYLIEHVIKNLVKANIFEIVINVSYHGEQIKAALGNGERYGVSIVYSEEKERLETGGGILQALPLLGNQPFLVLSSDVVTDYPLNKIRFPDKLAHLVLVDNPIYHPKGDFGLKNHIIDMQSSPFFTFSNIGVYKPELFSECQPGYFRLGTLLQSAIKRGEVTGEYYQGFWHNIGTPVDLSEINKFL